MQTKTKLTLVKSEFEKIEDTYPLQYKHDYKGYVIIQEKGSDYDTPKYIFHIYNSYKNIFLGASFGFFEDDKEIIEIDFLNKWI
jgi:hypothetical protein